MRVRFAPSPTGQLHVGNARTALFNWLLAHGKDGTFILRIEDTDAERSTRQSEASILEDLRWLGLDWDEGPDVGGSSGPYRQSERLHLYSSYSSELLAAGHAYYCFCSPQKLDADRQSDLGAGKPPRYHGTCRDLPLAEAQARIDAGERPVVRFRVPEDVEVKFTDLVRGEVTFSTEVIGDFVILRSDGRPQYNFAVVVDDALMEVTHVIRGEDHISNTPRQILLYGALGFASPEFAHLSLVMGPDHTPLSKRHGATSVAEFRARGYLPEALVNYLALLGWSPGNNEELLPADELARRFRLENVAHSAGVFDEDKLAWANRHYLKLCAPDRLATLAEPSLRERGFLTGELSAEAKTWLEWILPNVAGSVDRVPQLADRIETVFRWRAPAIPGEEERIVAPVLAEVLLDATPLVDRETFRAAANRVKDRTGLKGKALFHPIRTILTGANEGPELDVIIPAIERAVDVPGLANVISCKERAAAVAALI